MRRRRAFTLIELMVTVGLLSLIVLGLLAVFNQTQRAFRAGMTQTDILESGRMAMDLMSRQVEQMTPSGYPYIVVRNSWYASTNFFVEPSPGFSPFLQEMTDNYFRRTNVIQRFFFLTKVNQDWIGTCFQVIPDDVNGCIGTLYQIQATNYSRQGPMTVCGSVRYAANIALQNAANGLGVTNVAYLDPVYNNNTAWVTNFINPIADGIIHLRVRAFSTNGFLIVTNATCVLGTNGMFVLTYSPLGFPIYTNVWDTSVYGSGSFSGAYAGAWDPQQAAAYFMKEAVPAAVEIELGILEPPILKRYQSIPIPLAQRQYLSNHIAEVHLFRQRIGIRNIDFTAYP